MQGRTYYGDINGNLLHTLDSAEPLFQSYQTHNQVK